MSADELVGFFNTFGGGGKPIGGVHENSQRTAERTNPPLRQGRRAGALHDPAGEPTIERHG